MNSWKADIMIRALRKRYVLALCLIAVLILLSQGVVQYTIADQQGDSRVINIAGRQRMLSQRISKCGLLLQSGGNEEERKVYRDELSQSVELWRRSHIGLQNGDIEMGLPGNNSSEVKTMFDQVEPHFRAMLAAAEILLLEEKQSYSLQQDALQKLLFHQADFLKGMDAIVFQYDDEANKKIYLIKRIEWLILLATLITLLLEARFIFKPAERQLWQTFQDYRRSEANLQRLFDHAPTPMLLTDLKNLKVIRMNQAAVTYLKLSPEESEMYTLKDLFPDSQNDEKCCKCSEMLFNENVDGLEIPIQIQDEHAVVMVYTAPISHEGIDCLLIGMIDITAKQAHAEQLSQLANIDHMTNLLNRRAGMKKLEEAMQQACFNGQNLTLIYVDLDGLKMVNDTYGHQEGDWYINTVSALFRRHTREADILCRLGGDEFMIALSNCSLSAAQKVLNRIKIELDETGHYLRKPYSLSISVGVVELIEYPGLDAEEFLHLADEKMYNNKHDKSK